MRSIILIDGGNFYRKLQDLNLARAVFDYAAFGKWLTGNPQTPCTYYVGAIRKERGNPKSDKLYAKQQSFLAKLKLQGVKVELGYILHSASGYHEKGVDVKIATDLLTGACHNRYARAYLVSSDTDLIPAVESAKDSGKHIVYVGFTHKPSYALLKAATSSRLLGAVELAPFTSSAPGGVDL